eukprot:scaffold197998_cov34-Tisochrysis_lutea.AAC.5
MRSHRPSTYSFFLSGRVRVAASTVMVCVHIRGCRGDHLGRCVIGWETLWVPNTAELPSDKSFARTRSLKSEEQRFKQLASAGKPLIVLASHRHRCQYH